MSKNKQRINANKVDTIEDARKILKDTRTACVRVGVLDLQSVRRLQEKLDAVIKFCGRLYSIEEKTAKRYKMVLKERIAAIEKNLAFFAESVPHDPEEVTQTNPALEEDTESEPESDKWPSDTISTARAA